MSAAQISPVSYDRTVVSAGIVHFGVGNFHRSHQAMYVDRLLRNPETFESAREWGICGIGVLPHDIRMRDALAAYDGEYTLVERFPDGTSAAFRIGSLVQYLFAPEQPEAVRAKLAHPATRIVSLTITEGGYNISDATGEFDTTHPAIIADTQPGAQPSTVFGLIVQGLRDRRATGTAPFTVMSCDNIEQNGAVAKRCIVSFARLIDTELADWIDSEVAFPHSMVDRITPVTTDDDRDRVHAEFGVDDPWPVVGEDFVQWVLEDHFTQGRPPFEQAGVQVVTDVHPYELMKLRLLNAGHQALAFSGLLSGYQYAHEATLDPVIAQFLRAYMDREATSTLDPVPGVDLDTYKASLIARFSNPAVRDTLARLATDASDRIPKFLVPVITTRRARGETTPISAFVVAAWARYAELVATGTPLPFLDRQGDTVLTAGRALAADPLAILRTREWFGDLVDDAGFVTEYQTALAALRKSDDVRATISEFVGS